MKLGASLPLLVVLLMGCEPEQGSTTLLEENQILENESTQQTPKELQEATTAEDLSEDDSLPATIESLTEEDKQIALEEETANSTYFRESVADAGAGSADILLSETEVEDEGEGLSLMGGDAASEKTWRQRKEEERESDLEERAAKRDDMSAKLKEVRAKREAARKAKKEEKAKKRAKKKIRKIRKKIKKVVKTLTRMCRISDKKGPGSLFDCHCDETGCSISYEPEPGCTATVEFTYEIFLADLLVSQKTFKLFVFGNYECEEVADTPPAWLSQPYKTSLFGGQSLPTLKFVAADSDGDEISYGIHEDTTCDKLSGWDASALKIDKEGVLSGIPNVTPEIINCQVVVSATARGVTIVSDPLRVKIYPPLETGLCENDEYDPCIIPFTDNDSDGKDDIITAMGERLLAAPGELIVRGRLDGERLKLSRFDFDKVTVEATGMIYANAVITTDELIVEEGGRINASAWGHAAGKGPGAGSYGFHGGSGAGHGGEGRKGSGVDQSGGTYGNLFGDPVKEPTEFGSGGGRGGYHAGGPGGGKIEIVVDGPLHLDGSITANGITGGGWNNKRPGGGGSGGSVWIIAKYLHGGEKARISADGGWGGNMYMEGGGPGGGGRVAIDVTGMDYAGNIHAHGGQPYGNTIRWGGEGTVYVDGYEICDEGQLSGELALCKIYKAKFFHDGYKIEGDGSLELSAVKDTSGNIISQGQLRTANLSALQIDLGGDLLLKEGAAIRANLSSAHAKNIEVHAGAKIDLDGLGYQGGWMQRPGNGPALTKRGSRHFWAGAGGGNGGEGGQGNSSAGAGGTLASATSPDAFGAGGGGSRDHQGGAGGGLVKLTAEGRITVDGDIYARGGRGLHPQRTSWSWIWKKMCGGGGAGGSIWLSAATVGGSGSLVADGGSGGACQPGGGGGGGGGGRIYIDAVNHTDLTGQATFSVKGGAGGGKAVGGGDGTINLNGTTL